MQPSAFPEFALANHQHFANIVASQEELYGCVIAKEIFDVAVIEDALQSELGPALQLEGLGISDVIAEIRRLGPRVAGMEESQEDAAGLHDGMNALDGRLHNFFGKIVGNVPRHHSVELFAFVPQVLR